MWGDVLYIFNFDSLDNKNRIMGTGKKIILVGSGIPTSFINQIAVEKGVDVSDVVIVDYDKMSEGEAKEILNQHKDSIFGLGETRNLEIAELKPHPLMDEKEYYPTKKEIENAHPFSKFIKKGYKRK
jgi:hypothetical protein